MGVDTKLFLPNSVQPDDLADVAGILAGLPFSYETLKNSTSGIKHVNVYGAQAKPTSIAGMCEIVLDARQKDAKKHGSTALIDGEDVHFAYFHFDTEMGMRLFSTKSTGFWIAVCKGLGNFFGGMLDYDDCDAVPVNETFWEKQNLHWTDEAFDVFHKRLSEVEPLTVSDLIECNKLAAYGQDYSKLYALS